MSTYRKETNTQSTNDGKEKKDNPSDIGRIRDWKYQRYPISPEGGLIGGTIKEMMGAKLDKHLGYVMIITEMATKPRKPTVVMKAWK